MSQFTRRLQETQYNIAIVENSLDEILVGKSLRYRKMVYDNKDVWYADPFILDYDDDFYYILAEEMVYSLGRARISKLVINKMTMQLTKVIPLLTLPTHLSYPAIIRERNKIWVYPESGLSNQLKRYYYDQDNERFIEDVTIMEGPFADATITNLFGDTYLFCTKLPDCNGCELYIYRKNDEERFQLFQVHHFDEKIARMAGDFFKIGNDIYRPAQDCNKCYGNGTVIQKVELRDGKFYFTEVTRYFSPDDIYNIGIHTLNSYKGITVVDLDGKPRYPIARRIVKSVKKLLLKE